MRGQWALFLMVAGILVSCGSDYDINQKSEKLFTSIPSDYSNLSFINLVEQRKDNNHMVNVEFVSGGGVAVGDINNDGLQDIFFTGNQVSDKLYLNKGNFKFEDISDKAGIPTEEIWSTGVTFVDIDSDGDQDIYVCRSVHLENEKSANQLYINNGDLTFTEQAKSFGLDDQGFSVQAVFFDYDKDNLIDMYVVNQPPSLPGQGGVLDDRIGRNPLFSDRLFKNQGNGKFTDVTEEALLRNFAFGLAATVGDFNEDSWPDIYVSNDFDVADQLYINQKDGTFANMIYKSTRHISNFSMGSDVADYDNDGHLDIMVVDMLAEDHKRIKTHMSGMNPDDFWKVVEKGGHYQYMFNTLQRNNGNGTFSEVAQLGGVTSTDWSWGPLFADFDNDGYKDLFVTNGVLSNNRKSDLTSLYDRKIDSINQVARSRNIDPNELIDVMDFVELAPMDKLPNYIYKNNGDLTFSKMIEAWGLDLPTLSNGGAYADLDNDGDLDLVINNINDEALLYKNNARENESGNYVRFRLNNSAGTLYGVKVSLYTNEKIWQTYEFTNVRGFMSKSEDVAHFGLGTVSSVEKVIIEWPDGTSRTMENPTINTVHEITIVGSTRPELETKKHTPLFANAEESLNLKDVRHQENKFDDYIREILLPHKMSQFGPSIATGDVNGDGRDDFFIGGAAGFEGSLFIQNAQGGFDKSTGGPWSEDKASEDMGVVFVDVDNDNDNDLFIVSGGNEFEVDAEELRDRLYINTGSGKFVKSVKGVPDYRTSGSKVMANDYDKDGDMDLFIGGRLVPGKYPRSADSHILENRNGVYIDVTGDIAPDLIELGMVTDARWTDYNDDGLADLIIVGEWMPITVFAQLSSGKFEKRDVAGLENTEGWYYSIAMDDLDGDGDQDFFVGNLGLNYKYKSTSEEPFEVYSKDFDGNGKLDIVLSYYEHGEIFPVRGKSCSTQQMPTLGEKFSTYEEFGSSNLIDVYGPDLSSAFNLKAKTFASAYVENLGNGRFSVKKLPNLAQISSINSFVVKDFDMDGNKDVLVAGNLFVSEIETPRNDASIGLFLKGDGKGNFIPKSVEESGFFAAHDAKDLKMIQVGQKDVILVANNDYYLQAFEYHPPKVD